MSPINEFLSNDVSNPALLMNVSLNINSVHKLKTRVSAVPEGLLHDLVHQILAYIHFGIQALELAWCVTHQIFQFLAIEWILSLETLSQDWLERSSSLGDTLQVQIIDDIFLDVFFECLWDSSFLSVPGHCLVLLAGIILRGIELFGYFYRHDGITL